MSKIHLAESFKNSKSQNYTTNELNEFQKKLSELSEIEYLNELFSNSTHSNSTECSGGYTDISRSDMSDEETNDAMEIAELNQLFSN